MKRAFFWLLPLVAIAIGLFAFARPARADEARRAGSIRLETAAGARGPVVLARTNDGFSGELRIVNAGADPLVVSRVAVRGDPSDPRVPPKVTARLDGAVLPATIPPGGSAKAIVLWTPEPRVRLRQLFGHVVVTSSDEVAGEAAMGVRAQLPGPLGPLEGHVLSLVVALPLLGAALLVLARASGRRDDRTARAVALGSLGLQALAALYAFRSFAPGITRLDGNDGLQLVERAVWIRAAGVELFLGADGVSAAAVLVTSLVALFALVPERSAPRDAAGFHAAYLVLASAAPGALSAMDGALFLLFVSVAVVAASLLVGAWGGADRATAGARLAVLGAVAVALLAVAVFAVARSGDATFLVDGTKSSVTFGFPELSRVAVGARTPTLFGGAIVKVAFALVLVAALVLLGAFPLHGWVAPALASAPPAAGALVVAALPPLGLAALLRIGCAVVPEGMRWASGFVVGLGAAGAAYAALAALGQSDLRRLAAHASTSFAGFALVGAGSLTPEGLSGAVTATTTRGLACALALLLAGFAADRTSTRDVVRLAGIAAKMPAWAFALGAALLGEAGVLGAAGAWGPWLAVAGAIPNYAVLSAVAALALVVLAVAHLVAIARVAFGRPTGEWDDEALLEPFGGALPDLTPREWLAVAPLVALVVVLGVWPAPLLASTAGTARDVSTLVSPPGPDHVASR